MRKLLAMALALLLALSFASIASAEAELPYVELDWYVHGTIMTDEDIVNDALNEYVMEKLNCKINLIYARAEYPTTVVTKISAGEDLGIMCFGTSAGVVYTNEASRGAFYPIEELLPVYAPGTYALFPEDVWEGMKIGGHIYGIPSLKDNAVLISLIANKDMCEEMGLDFMAFEHNNFRDCEELFYEAKAWRDAAYPENADLPIMWNNDRAYPYNFAVEAFFGNDLYAVCNIDGIMDIPGYDVDTVFNLYETPEFLEYCIARQRMVDDGIYLYDYSEKSALQKIPNGVMFGFSWGNVLPESNYQSTEWVSMLNMADIYWTTAGNYTGAGTAISAHCKDPERALMFLELVNTDPYVATTMRFGAKGIHWDYDADGKVTFDFEGSRNADSANRGYYYWYHANVGNLTIVEAPESLAGPDGQLTKLLKYYNDTAILSNHMGFSVDQSNILNELASCTNIVQEYIWTLAQGQSENQAEVESLVAEMNAKLKANGVDAIIDDVQRQIDEWIEARG